MVAACGDRQKRSIVAPTDFGALARQGITRDAPAYPGLPAFTGGYPSLFAWPGYDRVVK
jgi:hypothetical protein